MNLMKLTGLAFAFSLMLVLAYACTGNNSQEQTTTDAQKTETEAKHGEGDESTSAYVCPMHCAGSGSDEAGSCPVCGMAYETLEEHVKNGHDHQ